MISVHETEKLSLQQIEMFLVATNEVRFEASEQEEVYGWIERLLCQQEYAQQGRRTRGLLRRYIGKMTGLSRAQLTRVGGWPSLSQSEGWGFLSARCELVHEHRRSGIAVNRTKTRAYERRRPAHSAKKLNFPTLAKKSAKAWPTRHGSANIVVDLDRKTHCDARGSYFIRKLFSIF